MRVVNVCLCYMQRFEMLTRFTKFRVSNLHITSTPDAANTFRQRILPREAIPSHYFSLREDSPPSLGLGPLPPNITCTRAKPQQTPLVEKHAHPPRVVYCAKSRVSNLHITCTPDAANTLRQRSFAREAIVTL